MFSSRSNRLWFATQKLLPRSHPTSPTPITSLQEAPRALPNVRIPPYLQANFTSIPTMMEAAPAGRVCTLMVPLQVCGDVVRVCGTELPGFDAASAGSIGGFADMAVGGLSLAEAGNEVGGVLGGVAVATATAVGFGSRWVWVDTIASGSNWLAGVMAIQRLKGIMVVGNRGRKLQRALARTIDDLNRALVELNVVPWVAMAASPWRPAYVAELVAAATSTLRQRCSRMDKRLNEGGEYVM